MTGGSSACDEAPGMERGCLAEIETGREPGGADALNRLCAVLGEVMKDLISKGRLIKDPVSRSGQW